MPIISYIAHSMKMLQSRSKGVKGVETEATAPMTLPPKSPELEMLEMDANIAYGETEVNIAYGVVDEGTTEAVYEAMDTL